MNMMQRTLGATGLHVSQVGLGTWPLAGNQGLRGYGAVDPVAAEATVRAALAEGVTFFDTAAIYGDGLAEGLLGRLLKIDGKHHIVCTKGGWHPATGFLSDIHLIETQVHASCARLGVHRIDIYLLHNVPPHLIGIGDLYEPLLRLRNNGIIRHIGISVIRAHDAWLTLDRPEIEVVELPYSFMHLEADSLLSYLYRAGKGVIVREALASGLIAGRKRFENDDFRSELPPELVAFVQEAKREMEPYLRAGEQWVDFALRFVLDRPEVASVVVGTRCPEHVHAFGRAGCIAASAITHAERSLR
jgi:aryl-alcohol dehydrogenase-like predicted oxidoreductase